MKRKRVNGTYRWSEAQTSQLLTSIADEVKINPALFEKPTAQRFYGCICEKAPSLNTIKWDIMRSKMRHLKTTYMAALKWKKQTGAGLMENGQEKTVADHIIKICPHIALLETIFGQRISIHPPAVYQTSQSLDEIEVIEVDMDFSDDIENYLLPESALTDSSMTTDYSITPVVTCSTPTPQKAAGSTVLPSTSCNTAFSPIKKPEKKKEKYNKSSPISQLCEIQQQKLKLEVVKLQLEREKEEKKLQLEFDKLQFEREKEANHFSLQKMQLEKEERLEMERMRMQFKYDRES